MYKAMSLIPSTRRTTDSNPEAKPTDQRIANTLLHPINRRLKPNISVSCRFVVAAGCYTIWSIFYLESAMDILIGHSPIMQIVLRLEIITAWLVPWWTFFFVLFPPSFLISSILWDSHSNCIFHVGFKWFKSDFLWSPKTAVNECLSPGPNPASFPFSKNTIGREQGSHFCRFGAQKTVLSLLVCISILGTRSYQKPAGGVLETEQILSVSSGWWRILEAKAAQKSPLQTETRLCHSITPC